MNSREQSIVDAISSGDFDALEKLIEQDKSLVKRNLISVNLKENNYSLQNPSPLHLAVYFSNKPDHSEERKKILVLLISNGADINHIEITGHGPLHCAAKIGNLDTLKFLIEQGANLDLADARGRTPIFYAASSGHELLLQALIAAKADITIKDKRENSVLHCAVTETNSESIALLLIDHGLDFDEKNNDQKSPYDLAVKNDPSLAEKIHSYAMDHQAFYDALIVGDLESVEKRLAQTPQLLNSLYAAEITQGIGEVNCSCTPLQIAAIYGHAHIINFLLQNNIDSNVQDINGDTALHYAAFFGHQEAFDALLPVFKDIKMRNEAGLTVLHAAANYKGTRAMFEDLLAKGLSIHERDYNGQTPLHLVNNEEVAKILVSLGADKREKDNVGRTPFKRAVNKGLRKVMQFLQTDTISNDNNNNLSSYQALFKKPESAPYARALEEGKQLMKSLNYKEASKKFLNARLLLTQSASPNKKILDTIQEYYDKSLALSRQSAFIYQFNINTALDPASILTNRIRFSSRLGAIPLNKLHELFKELCSNPLLVPFLQYVAMDFLLNEKAHIRLVKNTYEEGTEGFFKNSSVVTKAETTLNKTTKGTIMHEIMHYYYYKAYQNLDLPFLEGDLIKMEMFRDVMKKILINFYKEIDLSVDQNRLMQMDTWSLGQEVAAKDNGTSEIRNVFLSIYTDYDESTEVSEFAARLSDLLGQGYKIEELKSLEPFIEFTLEHLIPDCEKFNLEMHQILNNNYSPNNRS